MQNKNYNEAKVLIIGEEPERVKFTIDILRAGGYTELRKESDPENAEFAFNEFEPDLVLLDLRARLDDGLDILDQIRTLFPPESFLPLLVLPADLASEKKMRSAATGGTDFLTRPFRSEEMLIRVGDLLHARSLHLDFKSERVKLDHDPVELTHEVVLSQSEMLEHLARAAEYRDDVAGTHIRRVGVIVEMLAHELGVSPMVAILMGKASLVHDLGKVAISDSILSKPGRLSQREFDRVKAHARFGAEILKGGRSKLMRTSETIARFHHERWDGGGYEGLKGESIPLEARITAVADVFDTLRNRRPYKEAWTHEAAIAEIAASSGTHFDPMVVEAFMRIGPRLQALFEDRQ